MIVVPANTLGSAASTIERRQTAASRPNAGPELLVDAGLERPLPFGFEIGAASAAFVGERRELPRFVEDESSRFSGCGGWKNRLTEPRSTVPVDARYAAPTRGLN